MALIGALFEIDKKVNFRNASVYYQFPIYPNIETEDTITANVIFLSQEYGVFIFQTVEYSDRLEVDIKPYEEKLSTLDTLIFAKILKESPRLKLNRRELKIDVTSVLFVNTDTNLEFSSEFEIVTSELRLQDLIISHDKKKCLDDMEFRDLKATIEGSKGLPKLTEREIKDPKNFAQSKGAILTAIESEICNFDKEQKRAALFVIDGAQRIRGLAGSGKTVILAMKAAIIHLQYPKAEILYTYYTKALNGLVKSLITRFYRQFADKDPDWDKIHILHAWGGAYLEGVYSNTCRYNNIVPMNLSEAKRYRFDDPFDYVCEKLNENCLAVQYDYALLDEAQDFPVHFYRVCRQITRKNRIVWAYDDFQNILNVDIQNEKETFGKDPSGNYYIDFSKRNDQLQDLILHRCYRNPRKILLAAFTLGLGVYNKKKSSGEYQMIQRLENNAQWEDLGFEVLEGDSTDGCRMVIQRPADNSSPIKNTLLEGDTIIQIMKCDSLAEEIRWVKDQILNDISRELKPEDITVICMDNKYVKSFFLGLSEQLRKNGVNTFNLLDVPPTNTLYKVKNCVTLSTIYSAKGNEAGSVYITGIDAVFNAKDNIVQRNKIFTAMTRSLAWVTLSGVGESVDLCTEELMTLRDNEFQLRFIQPSKEEVRTISQETNAQQQLLNKVERMAEQLKATGLSTEDIMKQIQNKLTEK